MRKTLCSLMLAVLALMGYQGVSAAEVYDFQELCMVLGKGGPWTVNDGGDAEFTVGNATMHYLGDYTEQGFEWNQRFAYEYNERGKFTMRNKSNKKDGNCGMFSWDYAHKFSILGLKNGDKVTVTIGTGTVTFVSTNVEGGVVAGDAVTSNQTYVISTEEETTHLDIEMAAGNLIAKIVIEPYGEETVPVITLAKSTLALIPGASAKVSATVDPSSVSVSWKSSDEAVATVDNGTITAVAAGTATISCYWESEISDNAAEASVVVTVADVDLSAMVVAGAYDFKAMGDVTLVIGEKAGSIYNAANSKNNDVFFCTNEGLENIAIQSAFDNGRGFSIVDGKGLFEGASAGRCAAVGGIKAGQVVEFFYTGSDFYTKSDGSDDGVVKTALNEGVGRAIFKAEADGLIGFELVKGNYVEAINIYEEVAEEGLADGVYYLYNELTDKFLSRGADWGTRAIVDDYGLPVSVTATPDGAYTLNNLDGIGAYGDTYWMYADCAGDRVRTFAVEKTDGGYYLHNSGLEAPNNRMYVYLKEDGEKYCVAGNATPDENITDDAQAVWQFLTLAERDALIAERDAAAKKATMEKAGIAEDAVLMNDGEAVELTFKNEGNNWTLKEVRGGNKNTNEYGSELYQATGLYTQTVEGLETGLYNVTVQAFYRDGSNENVAKLTDEGYNLSVSYLEANGSKVQIKSWGIDRSSDVAPNSMAEAAALFDEGKYAVETLAYVAEDGVLNLTVAAPSYIGSGWFIAGNVTYTKLAVDEVATGIETIKATVEDGMVYNLQGQRVMKAQKGLYIINGKKVVVK